MSLHHADGDDGGGNSSRKIKTEGISYSQLIKKNMNKSRKMFTKISDKKC